jgi:hypothetical protein
MIVLIKIYHPRVNKYKEIMFDDVFIFGKDDCFSLFYDEPTATKNGLVQTVKLFDGFFLGNVHAGRVGAALSRSLNLSVTTKLD